MKTIVFSGPSLGLEAGLQILADAVFLPPLKQADLISAITNYNPEVVCIIDDYSGQGESVWHSEILYALEKGVAVYGAAAVGAVRSFELEDHGMTGVGKVYQRFRDGELEDDDEVISLFICEQDGVYRRSSEPLVNLRETFLLAFKEGIIDRDCLDQCLAAGKELYWRDRTLAKLFSRLLNRGISSERLDTLRIFVRDNYCDIQRLDSLELLRSVRDKEEFPRRKKIDGFDFIRNRSDFLRILYERDRKVQAQEQIFSRHDLAAYTILNHPDSEEITFNALNREIALFMAGFLGLNPVAEDIELEYRRFRKKYLLETDESLAKWLDENDLSAKKFASLMRDLALCRQMQKWFLGRKKYMRLTKTALDELHLKNEYSDWKLKMAEREAVVDNRKQALARSGTTQNLSSSIVERKQTNGFPWHVSPLQGARESGLSNAALQRQLLKDKIFNDKLKEDIVSIFRLEE